MESFVKYQTEPVERFKKDEEGGRKNVNWKKREDKKTNSMKYG